MKNETKNIFHYLINLSFFLYFVILLVERVISIVTSITNGVNMYEGGFNGYVYTLTFLSIGGFFIFLFIKCRDNIKGLFRKENNDIDFKNLCISSGILLLSGMVHTEYTIPAIQFVAYGILIIGILLQVIINAYAGGDKVLHWLSFAYLVCFSMAIPVMYHSHLEASALFHVIEGFTSFILVGMFTYLLLRVFNQNDDLFIIWPIIIAVIQDVLLIALRWSEEINYFVLIFASLSLVLFLIGFIYKVNKLKRSWFD